MSKAKGCVVVTGERGIGKSTFLNTMMRVLIDRVRLASVVSEGLKHTGIQSECVLDGDGLTIPEEVRRRRHDILPAENGTRRTTAFPATLIPSDACSLTVVFRSIEAIEKDLKAAKVFTDATNRKEMQGVAKDLKAVLDSEDFKSLVTAGGKTFTVSVTAKGVPGDANSAAETALASLVCLVRFFIGDPRSDPLCGDSVMAFTQLVNEALTRAMSKMPESERPSLFGGRDAQTIFEMRKRFPIILKSVDICLPLKVPCRIVDPPGPDDINPIVKNRSLQELEPADAVLSLSGRRVVERIFTNLKSWGLLDNRGRRVGICLNRERDCEGARWSAVVGTEAVTEENALSVFHKIKEVVDKEALTREDQVEIYEQLNIQMNLVGAQDGDSEEEGEQKSGKGKQDCSETGESVMGAGKEEEEREREVNIPCFASLVGIGVELELRKEVFIEAIHREVPGRGEREATEIFEQVFNKTGVTDFLDLCNSATIRSIVESDSLSDEGGGGEDPYSCVEDAHASDIGKTVDAGVHVRRLTEARKYLQPLKQKELKEDPKAVALVESSQKLVKNVLQNDLPGIVDGATREPDVAGMVERAFEKFREPLEGAIESFIREYQEGSRKVEDRFFHHLADRQGPLYPKLWNALFHLKGGGSFARALEKELRPFLEQAITMGVTQALNKPRRLLRDVQEKRRDFVLRAADKIDSTEVGEGQQPDLRGGASPTFVTLSSQLEKAPGDFEVFNHSVCPLGLLPLEPRFWTEVAKRAVRIFVTALVEVKSNKDRFDHLRQLPGELTQRIESCLNGYLLDLAQRESTIEIGMLRLGTTDRVATGIQNDGREEHWALWQPYTAHEHAKLPSQHRIWSGTGRTLKGCKCPRVFDDPLLTLANLIRKSAAVSASEEPLVRGPLEALGQEVERNGVRQRQAERWEQCDREAFHALLSDPQALRSLTASCWRSGKNLTLAEFFSVCRSFGTNFSSEGPAEGSSEGSAIRVIGRGFLERTSYAIAVVQMLFRVPGIRSRLEELRKEGERGRREEVAEALIRLFDFLLWKSNEEPSDLIAELIESVNRDRRGQGEPNDGGEVDAVLFLEDLIQILGDPLRDSVCGTRLGYDGQAHEWSPSPLVTLQPSMQSPEFLCLKNGDHLRGVRSFDRDGARLPEAVLFKVARFPLEQGTKAVGDVPIPERERLGKSTLQLSAVIVHDGDRPTDGIYTVICRDRDGRLWELEGDRGQDETLGVSEGRKRLEEVMKGGQESAYLLMYTVMVDQCEQGDTREDQAAAAVTVTLPLGIPRKVGEYTCFAAAPLQGFFSLDAFLKKVNGVVTRCQRGQSNSCKALQTAKELQRIFRVLKKRQTNTPIDVHAFIHCLEPNWTSNIQLDAEELVHNMLTTMVASFLQRSS